MVFSEKKTAYFDLFENLPNMIWGICSLSSLVEFDCKGTGELQSRSTLHFVPKWTVVTLQFHIPSRQKTANKSYDLGSIST